MSGVGSQICIATYDHPCTLNTELPRPPRRRGPSAAHAGQSPDRGELASGTEEPPTWTPVTGVPNRLPQLPAIEHRWLPLDKAQPLHVQRDAPDRQSRGPYDAVQRKRVVYDYDDRVSQFRRLIPRDNLFFDSHFESGNLLRAERLYPDRSITIERSAAIDPNAPPQDAAARPLSGSAATAAASSSRSSSSKGAAPSSAATVQAVDNMFMDAASKRMSASVAASNARSGGGSAAKSTAAAATAAAAAAAATAAPTPIPAAGETQGYIMQEYNLSLSYDVHTEGNCQWFYLSVANMSSGRQGRAYKFNFCGFSKPDSEFNRGMQPFLYSTRAAHYTAGGADDNHGADEDSSSSSPRGDRGSPSSASAPPNWGEGPPSPRRGEGGTAAAPLRFGLHTQLNGPVGWIRDGFDIYYYELPPNERRSARNRFAMSCSFVFPFEKDVVYIAMCLPYTFTDLQYFLQSLDTCPVRSHYVQRELLVRTLAGNPCDVLTITEPLQPLSLPKLRRGATRVCPAASLAERHSCCYGDDPNVCATCRTPAYASSSSSSNSSSSGSGGGGGGAADGGSGSAKEAVNDVFVPLAKRKVIVISGRVHPGETCASWMVEGLISFITSEHPVARKLRRSTVFKVVPMMNPDGVINGNYRTSLSGVDLNRRYKAPDRALHPTIVALSDTIRSFAGRGGRRGFQSFSSRSGRDTRLSVHDSKIGKRGSKLGSDLPSGSAISAATLLSAGPRGGGGASSGSSGGGRGYGMGGERQGGAITGSARNTNGGGVLLFCDFHGHSRAKDIFIYGCVEDRGTTSETDEARLHAMVFPLLLSQQTSLFSMEKSRFKMARAKESTGRIVVNRELGIKNSFTLEASFCGDSRIQFSGPEWIAMGENFCIALYEYLRREGECPGIAAPTPQPQLFAPSPSRHRSTSPRSPRSPRSIARAATGSAAEKPPSTVVAGRPLSTRSTTSPIERSLSPSPLNVNVASPQQRENVLILTPKAAQMRLLAGKEGAAAARAAAPAEAELDVVVVAVADTASAFNARADESAPPGSLADLKLSITTEKIGAATLTAALTASPLSTLAGASSMGGMSMDAITAQLINLDLSGALAAATEADDAGSDDNPSGDELAEDVRARRVKDMQNGIVTPVETKKTTRRKKKRKKKVAPKGRGASVSKSLRKMDMSLKNIGGAKGSSRSVGKQGKAARPARVSRRGSTGSKKTKEPSVPPLRRGSAARTRGASGAAAARRSRSAENLADAGGATAAAGRESSSARARMLLRASYAYRRSYSESSSGRTSPADGGTRPGSGSQGSGAAAVEEDRSAMLRIQRRQITFAPDFVETPSVLSKGRGVIIQGRASPRTEVALAVEGEGPRGRGGRGGRGRPLLRGNRAGGGNASAPASMVATPHSSSLRSRFLRVIESRGVEVRGGRGGIPAVLSASSAATEISAARAQVFGDARGGSSGVGRPSPPAPPRGSMGSISRKRVEGGGGSSRNHTSSR